MVEQQWSIGSSGRVSPDEELERGRVAGFATWSGSAGHASPTASIKLTFHLDHSMRAAHDGPLRQVLVTVIS